jgi:hypothetical protein
MNLQALYDLEKTRDELEGTLEKEIVPMALAAN